MCNIIYIYIHVLIENKWISRFLKVLSKCHGERFLGITSGSLGSANFPYKSYCSVNLVIMVRQLPHNIWECQVNALTKNWRWKHLPFYCLYSRIFLINQRPSNFGVSPVATTLQDSNFFALPKQTSSTSHRFYPQSSLRLHLPSKTTVFHAVSPRNLYVFVSSLKNPNQILLPNCTCNCNHQKSSKIRDVKAKKTIQQRNPSLCALAIFDWLWLVVVPIPSQLQKKVRTGNGRYGDKHENVTMQLYIYTYTKNRT